ncbi:MAG: hypothetical protein D3916_02720 [Candidatus Electrothrix sp. MAN1_4]|nr:hypothetical protein [Candidatus Electrothrix sp. MAN1_4]
MRAKDSLVSGSVLGLMILLFIVMPLAGQAGVQKNVVVDGQYDDWDLDKGCLTPMHNDQGCTGEALPKVYLHYDNITNTVFVLVLQKGGIKEGGNAPVVNIYSLGHNIPVNLNGAGNISSFSWIMERSTRIGWEGAFQMTPGASYQCDAPVHTKVRTQSALKKKTASEVEVIDTEKLLFDCY